MGAVRCLLAIGLLAVCRGAKEDERDCEGAPRSPRCRALRRQSPPGCQSTRWLRVAALFRPRARARARACSTCALGDRTTLKVYLFPPSTKEKALGPLDRVPRALDEPLSCAGFGVGSGAPAGEKRKK